MIERQPVPKRVRFEVFKRDSFTCQYCGSKAPEVVLHVDHIKPVAGGGSSDILNLVTACVACNAGKGATKLDDRSAIERQRSQLGELQARREQIEMMLEWRDALEAMKTDTVEVISDRIAERGGGIGPNESGRADVRRWLQTYGLQEVLAAADEAFSVYMRWIGDKPDTDAWNLAFRKIPGVASVRRQAVERPWLPRCFYVQGILRKRFRTPRAGYVDALGEMITEWGATTDDLETIAKRATDWDDFNDLVLKWVDARQPRGGLDG